MPSTVCIPGFNMCGVVIEKPAGAADTPPVLRLDSVSKWGFLDTWTKRGTNQHRLTNGTNRPEVAP